MSVRLLSPLLGLFLLACGSEPEPPTPPVVPVAQVPVDPAGLTREAIEQAVFAAPSPAQDDADNAGEAASTLEQRADPAIVRAQILLDRAAFSPGVIDGLGGDNTRQAIAAFAAAHDLESDGTLNEAVFARLTQADRQPVLMDYTLTAEDVAGPFIGRVPDDLQEMARLEEVGYATVQESIAEKFHMTEPMLAALNPGKDLSRAGTVIVVPAVGPAELPRRVERIVVDKQERSLRAYDAEGVLLAFYPATIGSEQRPAPSGTLTVVGVAPEPNYTYDPDRLSFDRGDRRVVVPPGPNNPVGSVWIDLSRQSYGIHGTPDPSQVGKSFSNGCVRLTNWDAEQLAAAVRPGVEVRFI